MNDRWDWLAFASDDERAELAEVLAVKAGTGWLDDWGTRARPEQQIPADDWRLWLVIAGRGFGKTRTGAEWVRHIDDPANIEQFLELVKNLAGLHRSAKGAEKRGIAEMATSNRTVEGKYAYVEPADWLAEARQTVSALCGPPHRDTD